MPIFSGTSAHLGALDVALVATVVFLAATWTLALVGTGYWFDSALDDVVGDNWGRFSVALLVDEYQQLGTIFGRTTTHNLP